MTDVLIVALDEAGVCPNCGTDYGPDDDEGESDPGEPEGADTDDDDTTS